METPSLYNPGYQRLIPRRYWHMSAASKHRFEILEPWWTPFQIVQLKGGGLTSVEPSAYCRVLLDQTYVPVLIPMRRHPVIGGAVTQFGKLLFTGTRNEKYMTLFKVYETICSKPDIKFAALRHALTHATAVLNRPKTVAALHSLFGTVHIDLSNYKHQNVFWRVLAQLLAETDSLLAAELRGLGAAIHMPTSFKQPLTASVAGYYFPKELDRLLSNSLLNTDAREATARAG